MTEKITTKNQELISLIERYSAGDGAHITAIPNLYFLRRSNTSEPTHGVYKPSFCMIMQGAKEVWLGKDRFRYSLADYLVSSVQLPVSTQVTEATPAEPYLGLRLEFSPRQTRLMLIQIHLIVGVFCIHYLLSSYYLQ
ncbi:AraC family transcriptional regulator [Paenibacillus sp. MWE-103]|uniref:AraC family transcriptional regulator n=1 Tax=Paenibacillus artemisiicola TaxID=1172618 RepID=A0ABS3WAS4_9BACL|nr:AraC family transcriptional regulator [Paenibacillus artemisiicola]MBO7745417.1 AraC family transcriptional regulator [Paenibacillus artemisiicola]